MAEIINYLPALTYADVLIVPEYSDIDSRLDIDVTSEYLGKKRLPIMSAPMDYVSGYQMVSTLSDLNAYGIVNRFTEELNITKRGQEYGLAVGTKNMGLTINRLAFENIHSVCIDVAHGHHKKVISLIEEIRKSFPYMKIIAGNVATYSGFSALSRAGADAVRVGIGPGSACSTRETTGVGVPQLTAIMNTAECKNDYPDTSLIADGGIQTPGDIVKALVAGADAVMLGRMLAGHDESPGDTIEKDGKLWKHYRGQSLLGTNGTRNAPEGVAGLVPYKGAVADTINQLIHYLRSGMSYVGARNIEELRQANFMVISEGTFKENTTRL